METKIFKHIPVLLKETIQFLNIKPNGVYVDATVGGAGHSAKIAENLTSGLLFCFDKDPDAIAAAKLKLHKFKFANFSLCSFNKMTSKLENSNISSIDGVLFDLGVSSFQLDEPSRGFSYKFDGPLDMRMSKIGVSAFEVVNKFDEKKLKNIIKIFGEEKFASSIVKKIVLHRSKQAITTTFQLADIVKSAVPAKFRRIKNPCKKTFQAIRIFINNELNELQEGLNQAFNLLRPSGRLVTISFHSLEDKIIKHFFTSLSRGCVCPPKTPICICNNKPKLKILTKKPILPSFTEQQQNPRSKSAKLRAIEKL